MGIERTQDEDRYREEKLRSRSPIRRGKTVHAPDAHPVVTLTN